MVSLYSTIKMMHGPINIKNQLDSLISQIYFWNRTLHVSDSSSVHHHEFFTLHKGMVYVIQVMRTACEQDQNIPSWSCSQAVSKPPRHIPLLCVQWKTSDDGQRNCPKHAEFYSKNKFKKLVLLVRFIIRIYLDAPSPERQIPFYVFMFQNSGTVRYSCIPCGLTPGPFPPQKRVHRVWRRGSPFTSLHDLFSLGHPEASYIF